MTPYDDRDLAALALARGVLRPEQLPAVLPIGWEGRLARVLTERGWLAPAAYAELARELERYARACGHCGTRFCALPATAPRRRPCPACGALFDLPGSPRGIPRDRLPPVSAGPPGGAPAHSARPNLPSGGLQAAPALQPGDRIGDYVVVRELSRGAMGVVYRARHARLDRDVALKRVLNHAADEEGLARFAREGEALARLDHPHVVRVYEMGVDGDGCPFLAMEYVEGGRTLRQLAEEGPLPPARAAALLAGVARGVAHMHERGVLHRDLKLANVLLDPSDKPVVADFGLVHLVDRQTRLTGVGDMLGTPLYMAPEVVTGEDEGGDPRVDVYSLGVILFRLVTGRSPFEGKTPSELFEKVLRAPLVIPGELSEDLAAVLERALARAREHRYPGAGELAADLEALAAGEPVSVRRLSREERLRVWARRHPAQAAAPLVLALVLLVLVAVAVVARGRTARARVAELEEAARDLDGLTGRLRRDARAPAQLLTRLELELARARELLERSAELGEEAAAARAALDGQLAALAAEHARVALAARLAEGLPEDARTRAALADAIAGTPPPSSLERASDRALEAQRGQALARLGRLEQARAVLERVLTEGTGAAEAPQRAAWALDLASVLVLLGRGAEAQGVLAGASDVEPRHAVELALLRAASGEREALEPAAERVARLPEGPARAALELALASERHRAAGWHGGVLDPEALDLVARARAQGDLARGAPGYELAARASLLEGDLRLALGQWASAADAFARARALGVAPLPPAPLTVPGSVRRVVPGDVAAALGEACARARLLDAQAARGAARRAVEAARGRDAWALGHAGALLAEALDLAGEAEAAEALEAELAREAAAEALARWRVRRARRRGDASAPEGSVAERAEARAHWAAGTAELACLWAWRDERAEAAAARERRLGRAERAFWLALSCGLTPAEDAWVGLADVAARRGAHAEAAARLKRAPGARAGWRGLRVEAALRAARGDAAGAADATLAAARSAGEDVARGELGRAAWRARLLLEGLDRLEADHPAEALRLAEALVTVGESPTLPFTPAQQQVWIRRFGGLASRVGDTAAIERAGAALQRLREDRPRRQALQKEIERRSDAEVIASSETRKLHAEYVRTLPTFAEAYLGFDQDHTQLHPSGGHLMALVLELDPFRAVEYTWSGYHRGRSSREALFGAGAHAGVIGQVLDSDELVEELTVAPDGDLRRAFGLMLFDLWHVRPPTARRVEALSLADALLARRPEDLASNVAAGVLRLAADDPAGALAPLERATEMPPPFAYEDWRGVENRRYSAPLLVARVHGWARRWEDARAALDRAVMADLSWPGMIGDDPAFREERARAGTLHPLLRDAHEQVKGEHLRMRGMRGVQGD